MLVKNVHNFGRARSFKGDICTPLREWPPPLNHKWDHYWSAALLLIYSLSSLWQMSPPPLPPLVRASVSDRLSRVCASSVPYGLKRRCYVGSLCSSSQSATMCYLTDSACGVERNVTLVQKYKKDVSDFIDLMCLARHSYLMNIGLALSLENKRLSTWQIVFGPHNKDKRVC